METRSLPAVSWAEMRLFSDLMRRKRRLEISGWVAPRREERLKPCLWEVVWEVEEEAPAVLRLLERIERARCLGVGWLVGGGCGRGFCLDVPLGDGGEAIPFGALAGHGGGWRSCVRSDRWWWWFGLHV